MRALNLLVVTLLLCASCRKQEADPIFGENDSFTYQLIQEGDGLVSFVADSTQLINEFIWDFGDNTTPVSASTRKTAHVFTKNATYQVKLTVKNRNSQKAYTKAIMVDTRLARRFDDLPQNERDTINILYVLTHESFKGQFRNPNDYEYADYQGKLFTNFLKRTVPDYPVELDRLIFKHIVYTLSTDEMNRFNAGKDPVGFLSQLLSDTQDPLFQKILDRKKKDAVSRIAFFLKDPGFNGSGKYPFDGFATYEGAYFVSLSTSQNTIAHEIAHTFGFAHDTLRDCAYFPLMVGFGTNSRGGCASVWNEFSELQVKGFANKLVFLERQAQKYQYAVPEYWRDKFPTDPIISNLTLNYISTTPYYREGFDLSKTLADALIAQHNIKRAPGSATSLAENPKKLSPGRLSTVASKQTVYCPN